MAIYGEVSLRQNLRAQNSPYKLSKHHSGTFIPPTIYKALPAQKTGQEPSRIGRATSYFEKDGASPTANLPLALFSWYGDTTV
jgi:hypothetical protein